jgi:hypothetical protein
VAVEAVGATLARPAAAQILTLRTVALEGDAAPGGASFGRPMI